MKLIAKVTVLFLMVFNLLSCSNDDEQATLTGKWEFYKNGYFYEQPESPEGYVVYNHACQTNKDYRFFTNEGVLREGYFFECNESSRAYKWSLKDNGKKLDIQISEGRGDIYEVMILNGSTLKLKYVESYGVIINKAIKRPSHVIMKKAK